MSTLTPQEQTTWMTRWSQTIWEYQQNGTWLPLPCTGKWFLLSAWNPHSQRLPLAVNEARDAVLVAELQARGIGMQRSRGRAADGSWSEDGWMISDYGTPDAAILHHDLLVRYGQLAGVGIDDGAVTLWWSGGN